jgi:hypothetical protein
MHHRVLNERECPRCQSHKVNVIGQVKMTQVHYGVGLTTFEYGEDFEPLVIYCRDCGREGRLL